MEASSSNLSSAKRTTSAWESAEGSGAVSEAASPTTCTSVPSTLASIEPSPARVTGVGATINALVTGVMRRDLEHPNPRPRKRSYRRASSVTKARRILWSSRHLLPALADGYLQRLELAAADHLGRHLPTDPLSGEQYQQVLGILDRLAVERRQDVTDYEATSPGGATLLDPDDQEAAPLRETEPLPIGQSHRLAQDAQIAALDGASLFEGAGDPPGQL